MSKRITLTDKDIELLVALLERHVKPYEPHNSLELAAVQRRDQLMAKLKIEPSISKVSASSTTNSIPRQQAEGKKKQ